MWWWYLELHCTAYSLLASICDFWREAEGGQIFFNIHYGGSAFPHHDLGRDGGVNVYEGDHLATGCLISAVGAEGKSLVACSSVLLYFVTPTTTIL